MIKSLQIRHLASIVIILAAMLSACSSRYEIKKVKSINHSITSSEQVSNRITELIAPYKQSLDSQMNKVIAHSEVEMTSGRPESLLSNFVTDLILSETRQYCATNMPNQKVDLALVNIGGLRIPIPKGEITVGTNFQLMPFENEVVILELAGKDLLDMFKALAKRRGEGISGATLKIRDGKPADIKIGGTPLNLDQKYWLATSDYVASGGDEFSSLKNALTRKGLGIKMRDVIIEHMKKLTKKGKMLNAKLDGRVSYE